MGFDVGLGRRPLAGFLDWLVTHALDGEFGRRELSWPGAIEELSRRESGLDEPGDDVFVGTLFEQLSAFVAELPPKDV
jgi:hypothetical protein